MRHSRIAGKPAARTDRARKNRALRRGRAGSRPWRALLLLVALGFGLGASAITAQAENDKIFGEWCRDDRSFKVERENVITYHGSTVRGQYDEQGLGVRYIAPSNEPEAGAEIAIALRSTEMAYLFRKPKGATGYSDREAWRRCKVTS